MSDLNNSDPGRFWRRMARWGAVASVFAVFAPLSYMSIFHELILHLSGILSPKYVRVSSPLTLMKIVEVSFLCLTPCMVLSGPVVLVSFNRNVASPGSGRELRLACIFGLYLICALLPFCVFLILLKSEQE